MDSILKFGKHSLKYLRASYKFDRFETCTHLKGIQIRISIKIKLRLVGSEIDEADVSQNMLFIKKQSNPLSTIRPKS